MIEDHEARVAIDRCLICRECPTDRRPDSKPLEEIRCHREAGGAFDELARLKRQRHESVSNGICDDLALF